MTVTPDDASQTLRSISEIERRSSSAYGYTLAAPHLILWGVIWFVGYGASYLQPRWGAYWPVLILGGMGASFWIGMRSKRAASGKTDWRYGATALAVFLFIAAQFAILPPHNEAQVAAYFPILTALFYGLVGIWTRGVRMTIAGLFVALLTIGGYFLLRPYFQLWMAVVGGGALILGGLWLRRV